MTVWVIEKHLDYEPGDILGIAATKEAALRLLERLGWSFHPPVAPYDESQHWYKDGESADHLTILEYKVEE